jgi:type IV pilus assembly protein PilW
MKKLYNTAGFTLIELLIAMAITGIVTAAIYAAFHSQQKSYLIQEDVADMQQNLRSGMDLMAREIRMAGFDPSTTLNTGITDASATSMTFTADDGTNTVIGTLPVLGGGTDTYIYSYDNVNSTLDRDINGSGGQPAAENIEAIGFAYAFDNDGDGSIDTNAGEIIWAIDRDGDGNLDTNLDADGDGDINDIEVADGGPGTGNNGTIGGPLASVVPFANIRAVRIWILARADRTDNRFVNTSTYVVGNQVITPDTDAVATNDSLRMRLLTTTIKCRNLGL